jgi:multidrug efflux pump
MSIPMMLGMAINMIYSITNTFYIGRLDNIEMLAAITLALPFTTVLMAIGNIIGTGGSTYISRLIGEKNVDGVKKASSANLYFSFSNYGDVQ